MILRRDLLPGHRLGLGNAASGAGGGGLGHERRRSRRLLLRRGRPLFPLAPAIAAFAAILPVPEQAGEECLVQIGHLNRLHGDADAAGDHLLRQRLARVQRHRGLPGGAGLAARVAARFPGREHEPHLRRIVGQVLAQLLNVRAPDLPASAHQLHRRAQIGYAAPLPRQIQRALLAALRHPHVAHPHPLEQRRAQVLEGARIQLRHPAAQRADHRPAHLRAQLVAAERPGTPVRCARLFQEGSGGRELHQRHPVSVDDEDRLAPSLGAPPVVLEKRGDEGREIAHQRLGEQLPAEQIRRELRQHRAGLALRERLEDHLGRRRKAPLSLAAQVLAAPLRLHLFVAFLVLGLQLRKPAPGLRVDRAGLALARPVERLAGLRRLHGRRHSLYLEILRDGPFDQREGALRRHRDDLAVVLALGHRSEALAHGDLRILSHVREKVLPQGGLGDFLVVERLAGAPQDLHGRLGERHVALRGSAVGTRSRLPFRRSENSSQPIELPWWCQRT